MPCCAVATGAGVPGGAGPSGRSTGAPVPGAPRSTARARARAARKHGRAAPGGAGIAWRDSVLSTVRRATRCGTALCLRQVLTHPAYNLQPGKLRRKLATCWEGGTRRAVTRQVHCCPCCGVSLTPSADQIDSCLLVSQSAPQHSLTDRPQYDGGLMQICDAMRARHATSAGAVLGLRLANRLCATAAARPHYQARGATNEWNDIHLRVFVCVWTVERALHSLKA